MLHTYQFRSALPLEDDVGHGILAIIPTSVSGQNNILEPEIVRSDRHAAITM